MTPEEQAREKINRLIEAAGWPTVRRHLLGAEVVGGSPTTCFMPAVDWL